MNPSGFVDPGRGYAGPDGASKMPSFNDSMTVQELVDLVAYLKTLSPSARSDTARTASLAGWLRCSAVLALLARRCRLG